MMYCKRGSGGHDHMVVSCIYNYLHNQCLSPLKLWVRIPLIFFTLMKDLS